MYLWQSLFNGMVDQVQKQLKHIDNEATYYHGQNSVHVGCTGGDSTTHVEVLKILIEYGFNLNAKDTFGNTPLHSAAVRGHVSMIKILLKEGADYKDLIQYNKYLSVCVKQTLLAWHNMQHWKKWAVQKRKKREKKYVELVWIRKNISCKLVELLKFI